jgi:hypothetical protein
MRLDPEAAYPQGEGVVRSARWLFFGGLAATAGAMLLVRACGLGAQDAALLAILTAVAAIAGLAILGIAGGLTRLRAACVGLGAAAAAAAMLVAADAAMRDAFHASAFGVAICLLVLALLFLLWVAALARTGGGRTGNSAAAPKTSCRSPRSSWCC